MKPMRFLFVLMLIVAGLSFETKCHATTAEEMMSACRPLANAKISNGQIELPSNFDSGKCWGAFEVLENVMSTRDAGTQKMMFNICLPEKVTKTELIAIFMKHMENHPEKYHLDFTEVAITAIWDAFHCKR
jgi:hypothetical protein